VVRSSWILFNRLKNSNVLHSLEIWEMQIETMLLVISKYLYLQCDKTGF